jgi:hypothetical protein
VNTGLLSTVRAGLVPQLDPKIVDEMLQAYVEAKQKFYAGGLRLSEVEGGRFCEAAFRLLQQAAKLTVTPVGKTLKTDPVMTSLAQAAPGSVPDSVRLHIPRALRVVYDIRNNRDAAHLGDGIDPNLQDATLVATVLDWVLAEFVRLYHKITADEARRVVDDLVTRKAPAVETFDDFLKVLNPSLPAGDFVLLLLYQRGGAGAAMSELDTWVQPQMRGNLKRTVERLEHEKAFVHQAKGRVTITMTGLAEVERRQLFKLPD